MYISKVKALLFSAAAGILAIAGSGAVSFSAQAGIVATEAQIAAEPQITAEAQTATEAQIATEAQNLAEPQLETEAKTASVTQTTAANQTAEVQNGSEDQVSAELQAVLETDIKAVYWIYNNGSSWSMETKDNTLVQSPSGSYATAIWASLENQPLGMTGTIEYQVNLSGFGWMEWQEHSTEAGDSKGSMPLEAVRAQLTGQVGEQYDIYYSVLQNGSWTDLVMNGQTAGTEGQGLNIAGLRMAIRKKGSGAPEEPLLPIAAVDPSKPMIALTFDDGPSGVTSRILDSLEANGAKATFYMVGNRMSSYPDTIRRMHALGCEIGSHTWNHAYISQLSASGIHSNLNQFDTKLQEIAGIRSATMRPPGGYINNGSKQALASYGVPAIMWSIDTLDWKTRRAQATIDTVLSQVRDGSIILMHDLYGTTADAAAVLIPELINRGYQLVTISELAAYRGGMQPGQVYHSFYP